MGCATTVIRAADQREVGKLVRNRASKTTVLDRSWVVLGRHGSFRVILESASPCEPRHFDAQRGAKMSQNRTQDGPTSKTKMKTKKDALEDRLGAVLGRSWVVLGAVLGPWRGSKHYVCRCFVNIHVFEKRRRQEATWTDLGSIWATKRLQNGGRGGSESEMN